MSSFNVPGMASSEPPRPDAVKFHASEIFASWRNPLNQLIQQKIDSESDAGYRVAAILPNQELAVEKFKMLESAGILVIEVPAEFEDRSEQAMADFLTFQLTEGQNATAARMETLGLRSPSGSDAEELAVEMSDEEEQEFLDFINDPAGQLGGDF